METYTVYFWIKTKDYEEKIEKQKKILEKIKKTIKILFDNDPTILQLYNDFIKDKKDYLFEKDIIFLSNLSIDSDIEEILINHLKEKYNTDDIILFYYFPLISLSPN